MHVDNKLSPKQAMILQSVANGDTVQDAAQAAGMSKRTAEAHLENARRRMGAKTTAAAVAKAMSLGLIEVLP